MTRVAIAGLLHETNTFAPTPARLDDFIAGGGWPTIQRGASLLQAVEGANLAVTGMAATLRQAGADIVPLLWATASPSAQVTREAYESLVGDMLERLREALPLDAVCMDLHGAMVCEHVDDGEGELLERVRGIVGPEVPVVAALDFHANVSDRMARMADAFAIYRTYPHVDMAQTGERAASRVLELLRDGKPRKCAWHRFDFLVPISAQSTQAEPMQSLMQACRHIETRSGAWVELAGGFPMSDVPYCGPCALAWAATPQAAREALDEIVHQMEQAESHFVVRWWTEHGAIEHAADVGRPGRPVVLADTQDNPGAGGDGDTTGLLRALVEAAVPDSTLGVLIDAESAAHAHEVGVGGFAMFRLGRSPGFALECHVLALGDGNFTCTGPYARGIALKLGPMAHLQATRSGVGIVVASVKCQTMDQAMFRHVGVEPASQRILAVKSSVHFRADFEPMASEVLVVRSPGPALANPAEFAWRNLRAGVRLSPKGPEFDPVRVT